MANLTESVIESAALSWFSGLGCQTVFGPDIAPDMPAAEREDYGQVVLEGRLRDVLWLPFRRRRLGSRLEPLEVQDKGGVCLQEERQPVKVGCEKLHLVLQSCRGKSVWRHWADGPCSG